MRPKNMMRKRQIRDLVTASLPVALGMAVAGILTVAGCGTTAATAGKTGTTIGTGTGTSTGIGTSDMATGCASIDLATKVTVIRAMHLIEPQRAQSLEQTQTSPAKVQALFRDFCQVLAHRDTSPGVLHCPDQIGLSYGGAFFAGDRLLAEYVYGASGCQRVTVTAPGGKAQSAIVFGTAAAAAPNLESDMSKVLGLPQSVYQGGHVSDGGGATS
jgi:hypothetical protein